MHPLPDVTQHMSSPLPLDVSSPIQAIFMSIFFTPMRGTNKIFPKPKKHCDGPKAPETKSVAKASRHQYGPSIYYPHNWGRKHLLWSLKEVRQWQIKFMSSFLPNKIDCPIAKYEREKLVGVNMTISLLE